MATISGPIQNGKSPRWTSVLLGALFLAQALLVGAHVHGGDRSAFAGEPRTQSASRSKEPQHPDKPVDCPRCQLSDLIGQTLLPSGAAFLFATTLPNWDFARSFTVQAVMVPFNGWDSRAPPPKHS